jgi:LEA14-like dessication related protein
LSKLQGRIILFAAIGGLFALMGFFVFYASLDNPELEKIEIELDSVDLKDVNSVENHATLEISLLIKNPSEKTFTIAIISYELFANGNSIGTGQYSTVDIPMPGRAAFYPGSEIALKNFFKLTLDDNNVQEYQSITNGENVQYRVKGEVTVENAWSIIEKNFESSL